MKLYVYDTDVAGFAQQNHPAIVRRISSLHADDNVTTTVVTFGEDLSGWLPACRRAPDGKARTLAYSKLLEGLSFYRDIVCLPFDEVAGAIFDNLRSQKIRIGTNDLAIAAITLSVNGILVTRNAVDFQRIPGLIFEDWTI